MIDHYLFEQKFRWFEEYIFQKSGLNFTSFSANPYLENEEAFKYDIYRNARKLLRFETWQATDIGKGDISRSLIKAIELPINNLVQWQSRYGEESRLHHSLRAAVEGSLKIKEFDSAFYCLYRGSDDANSFNCLVELFGRRYPLIAYLLFLKDRSRYMPIAPKYFDQAFSLLGVDFSTRGKCSWQNYEKFNGILSDLKDLLSIKSEGEVSLLDAHSFAWIMSKNVDAQESPKNEYEYSQLSEKDRETVIKARRGQGRFRESLIQVWQACAVTECQEESLLIASHIKPWKDCDVTEAVDPFNGLLLSPALDAAFDEGWITFDDTGNILISPSLCDSDAHALGISPSLYLKQVDPKHKPYLHYHRKNLFRKR